MKKSLILLSICSAVLLTSCGTSSYYASSSFEDGIYYRPSQESRAKVEADNAEVRRLIEQTRQEAARFSDTIVIASANSTLDVSYTPDTQYTIMFDDQLDSLGQLNLNFNFDDWYPCYGYRDYYSYWDWRYWNVFGPSWHRWGWYNSWYWGWYDPWYWSWGIGFAWDPWYGPWGWFGPGYWGPGYWGPGYWGWYDPWYGPWGYPVASVPPSYHFHGKRNVAVRTGGLDVRLGVGEGIFACVRAVVRPCLFLLVRNYGIDGSLHVLRVRAVRIVDYKLLGFYRSFFGKVQDKYSAVRACIGIVQSGRDIHEPAVHPVYPYLVSCGPENRVSPVFRRTYGGLCPGESLPVESDDVRIAVADD